VPSVVQLPLLAAGGGALFPAPSVTTACRVNLLSGATPQPPTSGPEALSVLAAGQGMAVLVVGWAPMRPGGG
jgi:hypothetical protein